MFVAVVSPHHHKSYGETVPSVVRWDEVVGWARLRVVVVRCGGDIL